MYRFQSVNTGFFVVSNENDKPGQEVDTKPGGSIPKDSILHSNVPIVNVPIAIAEITGATGLYISLKGDANKTRLTWSKEKYSWIVRMTGSGTYVITPADGTDLYWFDEFGIGNHVEVRPGRDIKPPQNEWAVTPP